LAMKFHPTRRERFAVKRRNPLRYFPWHTISWKQFNHTRALSSCFWLWHPAAIPQSVRQSSDLFRVRAVISLFRKDPESAIDAHLSPSYQRGTTFVLGRSTRRPGYGTKLRFEYRPACLARRVLSSQMNKRTFLKLSSASSPLSAWLGADKLTNWAGNLEYSTETLYAAKSQQVLFSATPPALPRFPIGL